MSAHKIMNGRALLGVSSAFMLVMSLSAQATAQGTLQDVLGQTTQPSVTTQVAQAAMGQVTQTDTAHKSGFLGGIFSCSSHGNKQEIGAAAGGVVGGVLGNVIVKGNKTLGTLAGAALGAAAGGAIGCKLQKNDQAKAERAAQAALNTDHSQSWSNSETGAKGSAVVTSGGGMSGMTFASGVKPAAAYTNIGADYITSTSGANVRNAPSKTAPITATLASGQKIYVPAGVKGQPWVLYAQSGVAQGYIATTTIKRVGATTTASSGGCKTVKNTVNAPGEAAQVENLKACKDSNGQWVIS